MFTLENPLQFLPAIVWILINLSALIILLGAVSFTVQRKDFQNSTRVNLWLWIRRSFGFGMCHRRDGRDFADFTVGLGTAILFGRYFAVVHHHGFAFFGSSIFSASFIRLYFSARIFCSRHRHDDCHVDQFEFDR